MCSQPVPTCNLRPERPERTVIARTQRANRHDFGETLPPEEKMWIAEEVDTHIQSCLRALAEGGAVVQADDDAA